MGKFSYTRAAGSQYEIPTTEKSSSSLAVGGYQSYTISPSGLENLSVAQRRKFALMQPVLDQLPESLTLVDIGCSSGAIGLQSILHGRESVRFLDHDAEYIEVVRASLRMIGRDPESATVGSVGSQTKLGDIGIALALIHWIYSYTESFGDLTAAISALKEICPSGMFVEWVSPKDPAISLEHHVERNAELHRAPYSRREFQKALRSNFRKVLYLGHVTPTRSIWFATDLDRISLSMRDVLEKNTKVMRPLYGNWKAYVPRSVKRPLIPIHGAVRDVVQHERVVLKSNRTVWRFTWGRATERSMNECAVGELQREGVQPLWFPNIRTYDSVGTLWRKLYVWRAPRLGGPVDPPTVSGILTKALHESKASKLVPWCDAVRPMSAVNSPKADLRELSGFLDAHLQGLRIPQSGEHGDFIDRNMLMNSENQPVLFDFEYYNRSGSIVVDVLRWFFYQAFVQGTHDWLDPACFESIPPPIVQALVDSVDFDGKDVLSPLAVLGAYSVALIATNDREQYKQLLKVKEYLGSRRY